jgi:adenylate cyclase
VRKPSLRTLLTVPFLVQIIGAVSLVGWLSFKNGERAVTDLTGQLMSELTQRIGQNLSSYLDEAVGVNEVNQVVARQRLLPLDPVRSWETYLWRQVQSTRNVNFIKITDRQGQQWTGEKLENGELRINLTDGSTNWHFYSYQTDSQGKRTHLKTDLKVADPREGLWYKEPLASNRRIWSSVFPSFLEDTLLIAVSEPVHDPDTHKVAAILNTAVRLNSIGEFLKGLKVGKTGQAFLLELRPPYQGILLATSTGEIPFHLNSASERKLFPALDSRNPVTKAAVARLLQEYPQFQGVESTKLKFRYNQENYFLKSQIFADPYGLRWMIMTVVPESDFMAQIRQNNFQTIALCSLVLVIAAGSGILTAHWISAPLLSINRATKAIAQGNLSQNLDRTKVHTQEVGELVKSFTSMATQLQESFEMLEQRVVERTAELASSNELLHVEIQERQQVQHSLVVEQEKVEQLLLNMLPSAIVDRLKQDQSSIAEYFEEATILFADIVDFTPLSERLAPLDLVALLNRIFCRFDQLAERFNLEKIKTIGDAYMVASGLPLKRSDHAEAIAEMALAMQQVMVDLHLEDGCPCRIRIGINSGTVVAGVIGTKKFIYDLWGDSVNIASRMESHGEPGRIHITEATYQRIKHSYELELRGMVPIKGKGMMKTYWLKGKKLGTRSAQPDQPSRPPDPFYRSA